MFISPTASPTLVGSRKACVTYHVGWTSRKCTFRIDWLEISYSSIARRKEKEHEVTLAACGSRSSCSPPAHGEISGSFLCPVRLDAGQHQPAQPSTGYQDLRRMGYNVTVKHHFSGKPLPIMKHHSAAIVDLHGPSLLQSR